MISELGESNMAGVLIKKGKFRHGNAHGVNAM